MNDERTMTMKFNKDGTKQVTEISSSAALGLIEENAKLRQRIAELEDQLNEINNSSRI
jgi:hypothetical protein